jgi:broad specificity phosphatase PhoE
MVRVVLVKHAMPVIDPTLSANEWVLSAEGKAAALRLGDLLEPYEPIVVVSSEEPKAQETARIVAERRMLPLQVRADLHEHDRQGVPYLDESEFRAAVYDFFCKPSDLVFGRETAEGAYERFRGAVARSIAQWGSGNIVIVAHGTVISLLVGRMTGTDPYPLWQRLGLPSFVVVSWPQVELLEVVERIA